MGFSGLSGACPGGSDPAPDEATRRRVETRDREEDEEQGDEDEELYRVCWGTYQNIS